MKTKPPFPEYIDSSMRATMTSCQKQFYWQYLRHLAPLTTPIDLHFGGCFASGLEAARHYFYSPGGTSEGKQSRALAAGLEAILIAWGPPAPATEGKPPAVKTLDICLLALESYTTQYPFAFDHLQPLSLRTVNGEVPAVECSFALPIPEVLHPETGLPLFYCGRYDMLAKFNNNIFVVDEKTTTQLGPTWTQKWELRGQLTGYCWAARIYGFPVVGAIIRGIAIRKHTIDHIEVLTYRSSYEIDLWYGQLVRDLQHIVNAYQTDYYNYAFNDTCTAYRGCHFQRLCKSPQPERWISTNYREHIWSPLTPKDTPK